MSFRWSISGGIGALGTLAGVRFDRLFTDLDAIVEAYREGSKIAREMFPPDVVFGPPLWAPISYGHINCLGSELIFPEDSQVAHTPIFHSLAQGVEALRREVDFSRAGMFPFYLELWEKLKQLYPEHEIPFAGFGLEGPVTTAWLLRGHAFFMDLYDDPPLAQEYLRLVTQSIVEYNRLIARVNGRPEFNPDGMYIADDGAAMIAPRPWPEFVVPYLEQYYSALTSGARSIHLEDMHPDHLPYLDQLRIAHYDPSVSRKLTPATIRARCSVPFTWRLNESHAATLTAAETKRWVLDAAAQGAPAIRTGVSRVNCSPKGAENVRAFIDAAQRVQNALISGQTVDDLLDESLCHSTVA